MMIKPCELLKACNRLLSDKYPDIKLYGKEVTDGYKKPSFFTDLLWSGYAYGSKNYAQASASFIITYFQMYPDEADQLEKVSDIQEIFGMYVETGSRKIKTKDFEYDYIGEAQNILQITISFEWTEIFPRKEAGEPAESLEVNIEKQ